MNINKYDLIYKLEKMFDIDEVKNYDLNNDYILWGRKETDNEGQFIWGEIIAKDNNNEYSDVMFGFTYDKTDSLYGVANDILNEIDKIEKEIKNNEILRAL